MLELGYEPETGPDDLRCHEAYVEVLACFWHRYLYLSGDRGRWDEELRLSRMRERRLYLDTCAQIRRHQETGGRRRPTREGTHVLAYFFAKAALWDRLEEVPAFVSGLGEGQGAMEAHFWRGLYQVLRPSSPFWEDVRSRCSLAEQRATPLRRPLRMTGLGGDLRHLPWDDDSVASTPTGSR